MRSKIFMLAAVAMLAASMPAQAILTLEFWGGVQDMTAGTGVPAAPVGLTHYGLKTTTTDVNGDPFAYNGAGKLSNLSLNVGQTYVLRIVLRDQGANLAAANEAAAQYTFAQNQGVNGAKLNTWAVNFQYAPGIIDSQRDTNGADNQAQTVSVWAGTTFSSGTPDGSDAGTSVQENIPFAVANFGPDNYTLGNLYNTGVTVGENNVVGQPINNTANSFRRYYTLANVVITATAAGNGNLVLRKPNTPPPTFGGLDNSLAVVSYDNDIWGVGGTNQYVLPFTVVPEPSSMVLAGLAVSGLGYKLRRKFRRETTTA